jgi:hypothetical protein
MLSFSTRHHRQRQSRYLPQAPGRSRYRGPRRVTRPQVEVSINNGGFTNIYTGTAISLARTETASGSYVYRARGCNGSLCGGYKTSGAVPVLRTPGAPTIAGGGLSGNGAYTISWSAVGDATSYNLVESANGAAFQQVQFNGATTWATSGRGNGTYTYQVQGCNALSCGPWSSTTTVTVALAPPAPSGVQTIKTTAGANTYRFMGVWGAVGGATRYEVRSGANTVYSGTSTSYVLQSGTTSFLQGSHAVRACNASGCSAWISFPSA